MSNKRCGKLCCSENRAVSAEIFSTPSAAPVASSCSSSTRTVYQCCGTTPSCGCKARPSVGHSASGPASTNYGVTTTTCSAAATAWALVLAFRLFGIGANGFRLGTNTIGWLTGASLPVRFSSSTLRPRNDTSHVCCSTTHYA